MICSLCAQVNPDKAQFCTNCGAELKRPGLNFFSVLGISGGSILSISVVGGIIGTIVGVIYVSSSSDFQDDGSGLATFFAFLIVLVFLGGGALVGAILGAIVGTGDHPGCNREVRTAMLSEMCRAMLSGCPSRTLLGGIRHP